MGSVTVSTIVFIILIMGVQSLVKEVGIATPCKLAFKDCGSVKAKVDNVSLIGTCDPTTRGAILKRGTTVRLEIALDSEEDTSTLKAVVHGIIAGIPVPFNPDNPDGCNGCNVDCPVKKGKHYLYTPAITVKNTYPKFSLVVKWELKDGDGNDLVCIVVPAVIT